MAAKTLRLGLCQMLVGTDKAQNLIAARKAIDAAKAKGAELVSLPECFNSPYATDSFPKYAEKIPADAKDLNKDESPSTHMLIEAAKANNIILVGGSFPEKGDDNKIYNTCIVISSTGEILAKHRKMHLFDIDVPGGVKFKESDTLSAGNTVTTFDTKYGKIGVAICYDMRFPQLAMLMRNEGCSILIYPGAFNTTTGPPHWELLQRARALDNQVFVATASPARNPDSKYQAWGHSTVVDPWGSVLATTGHEPDLVIADLNLERTNDVRTSIPVSKQVRTDIYNPVSLAEPQAKRTKL